MSKKFEPKCKALRQGRRAWTWKPIRYLSEFGSDKFFGDLRFIYATMGCAELGTATAPLKIMSPASSFLPYSFSFAPLSGRTVEPARETPAKRPRALEYVRTSARKVTSVAASA